MSEPRCPRRSSVGRPLPVGERRDAPPDAVIMEGNEIRLVRGLHFGQWIVRAFCEGTMTSNFEPTVMPGGESAGLFDSACNRLREITKARCVTVIVSMGSWDRVFSYGPA
jgi:hypothetical protein